MRSWSFGSVVVVSLAALLVGACGGSDASTQPSYNLEGGAALDAGNNQQDTGAALGDDASSGDDSATGDDASSGDDSGDDGGGGSCGSCTTDSDCQSTCPPVQGGGSNCCDTSSGVCYATTQSACPQIKDAGKE